MPKLSKAERAKLFNSALDHALNSRIRSDPQPGGDEAASAVDQLAADIVATWDEGDDPEYERSEPER